MSNSKLCKPWEHTLSRRQLLGGGVAAGALGLGNFLTPAVADQMKQKDKQVLFIWIDGGMSQLETWDPKPGTRFGGPFRAIPTSVPGIHISELMPKTAQVMKHLAICRGMCTQDNSHSAGVARIQRGDPKNRGVIYPFFGSAVAKLMGAGSSGLPPYVWIKPGSGGFVHKDAGFLGPKYGALAFGDGKAPPNMERHSSISDQDETDREELQALVNQRYVKGRRPGANEASSYVYGVARTLMHRRDLFDESTFSQRDKDRYGSHALGRNMLQGRKMLEAGVRFVKVNSYGWDTHGDNFNGHASRVPKYDQAFSAIIEDLHASGQLEHTLVISLSEFGRTPRINGHVGRDHWPEAWSITMAGCGINKGIVVGKTNAEGTWVEGEQYDIGHMFHTWFKAIGIDPTETEYINQGQPLPICHDDMSEIKPLLS